MPLFDNRLRQVIPTGLASILIAATAFAQPADFDVTRLMHLLAKVEAHDAQFVEKKQLALLTEPLVSTGTLRYRRPSYVERNTTSPKPERFIYENDLITIETQGRQRRIQAETHPALGALIESIRATLAGDEAALRRHYHLVLTGIGVKWTLELTPVNAGMARRIRQIRIAGNQDQLRLVEVFEVSGDQTQMTIDPVRP